MYVVPTELFDLYIHQFRSVLIVSARLVDHTYKEHGTKQIKQYFGILTEQ